MVNRDAKTKIRVFSFIFIMLAIIIIAVAASSTLKATTLDSQQESSQQQETSPGINSNNTMNNSDNSSSNSLPSVSDDDEDMPGSTRNEGTRLPDFPIPNEEVKPTNYLMTEEEALGLAMPIIEQYSKENNRTIITVKATFYPNSQDRLGQRGGPTFMDVANSDLTNAEKLAYKWPTYPAWAIDASFVRLTDTNDYQYYIIGYQVGIWADTREIRYSQVVGFY